MYFSKVQKYKGRRGAYATQDMRDTPKRIDAHMTVNGSVILGNKAGVRDAASKLVCDEREPGRLETAGPCIVSISRQVLNPVAAHLFSTLYKGPEGERG